MPSSASILGSDAFHAARRAAVATLLGRRTEAGHWLGHLSSSALSTATAINALRLVDARAHASRIEAGVQRHQLHPQVADGVEIMARGWANEHIRHVRGVCWLHDGRNYTLLREVAGR